MENEKLFELVTKIYSEMQEGFEELKEEIRENKASTTKIESKIENDITSKLEALFDGHIQNTHQLERIEKEVLKHDEIILRRIQ
ncbi:MAG: hypothetical protein GX366_06050 [Epulopiscium sp.]|nr:hypothetical protein [Candidatus Epulonipiscium sp.]